MQGARSACSVLGTGLLLVVLGTGAATGQTTVFTYQGQLTAAGTPANGSYDLQCALFDSAAGGTQIGTTLTRTSVAVSSGVFTVQLDFGVSAFPGANRFLEIGVRPTGGGSFTTLAPRQQISSTPYAIRTLSAATADALSSACVGCVQNSQIQSVAGSKVSGSIPAASVPAGSGSYVQNTTTQQTNSDFNISGNGTIGGNLTVAGTFNANASGNFIQNRTTPQPGSNFNISGNGTVGGKLFANNAGIGTTTPISKLHVVSGSTDILPPRLESSGTDGFAAGWDFYQGATPKGYVGVPDSGVDIAPGEMLVLGAPGVQLSLWAGGNRSVTIGTNGHVGIGTANVFGMVKLNVDGGDSVAVAGNSTTNIGVAGFSEQSVGVCGDSLNGTGVEATTFGTTPNAYGLHAGNNGSFSTSGSWAAYFDGRTGGGSFQVASASLLLDHPLDPQNKYLQQSFVASPDMLTIYNGSATTDANGEAVVTLPSYFEALNQDYRYQLTAIGAPAPNLYIAEEIKDNCFKIAGGQPGMKVSWQVTGIRQDPFAKQNRCPVEEDKPKDQRKRYLYPKAYGQPETMGIVSRPRDVSVPANRTNN